MKDDFPYQIVAFLGDNPEIGEGVYNGPRGWFAQIALKRRFNLAGVSKSEIVNRISNFCEAQQPLTISVGNLIKPERMPVYVLEVEKSESLMRFHKSLIKALGTELVSRYPERDGENYLPHITSEYDGKYVIASDQFKNREYLITKICLLKDISNDSLAYKYFDLNNVPPPWPLPARRSGTSASRADMSALSPSRDPALVASTNCTGVTGPARMISTPTP